MDDLPPPPEINSVEVQLQHEREARELMVIYKDPRTAPESPGEPPNAIVRECDYDDSKTVVIPWEEGPAHPTPTSVGGVTDTFSLPPDQKGLLLNLVAGVGGGGGGGSGSGGAGGPSADLLQQILNMANGIGARIGPGGPGPGAPQMNNMGGPNMNSPSMGMGNMNMGMGPAPGSGMGPGPGAVPTGNIAGNIANLLGNMGMLGGGNMIPGPGSGGPSAPNMAGNIANLLGNMNNMGLMQNNNQLNNNPNNTPLPNNMGMNTNLLGMLLWLWLFTC